MAKKEYLTISEFAERAAVSRQTVYNNLDKKLSKFTVEIDNKKLIEIKGLEVFGVKKDVKVDTGVDKEIDNNFTSENNSFKEVIKVLTEQLREKDKQIERLQEELRRSAVSADEKDKYIQEQGRRLAELLEQANKLQENNQVLIGLANDYKAKLEEGSSSNSNEKKGFFRRLFKDSE